MSTMLRKFISERCFCGLDIGADTIKASIIKCSEGLHKDLLGVYEIRTSGFKNASITNLADLSECIHDTIAGLTRKSGVKLNEIQLGIGGQLIESRYSAAVIPVIDKGNKEISQADVKKVQLQSRLLGTKLDEVILHEFAQYYRVDDNNMAINPLGLFGCKLEIKSLLILSNSNVIKNLIKAVNQAGYDVTNYFFTSLASTVATLNEYQMKQGSVLIDIGSTTTQILIFKEGILKFIHTIPIGGEYITKNISQNLQLAFDLAENIKRSYGFASSLDEIGKEDILIKREEGYLPIKKEAICQIIEPVVNELIDLIVNTIKGSGLFDQLNAGIIMVGGGSLLPGLPERIEQIINMPVKLGKISVSDKKLYNASKYAAAVGLAQLGINKAYGFSAETDGRSSFASRIANRIKELYQEYF